MFEDAPENTRETKPEKGRDVWSEASGSTKASSRLNSLNSSTSSQGSRNSGP